MNFPSRLPIPEPVLRIAEKLEAAGHETWCVGGAVRDNLLDYPNKDFDLATAATPGQVQRLFRRTIPVGIEHGTVGVLDRDNQLHEVTSFRRDIGTDGRHAVVEFGASLEEDLARRDFTINAIAYHPVRHEWRDPFDGAADLDARVIRAVGDPDQRFREDYLRILRALRFAARFGFTIEEATWAAATATVAELQHLSAERVRDEWFKGIVTSLNLSEFVRLWEDVGAMGVWMPDVVKSEKREVKGALARLPSDPVLITSYLSEDPAITLSVLKCSNAEVERGRRIASYRDDPPDASSEVSVRKWMARVGDAVDDLLTITCAEQPESRLSAAVERVRDSGAPLSVGQLAVNGATLMEAGIPEGPEIGRVLRRLLEDVLEDPTLNSPDKLMKHARTLFTSHLSPFTRGREGEASPE
ncbi:MAG: CCA tRNA nucleotidyltransferase [Gemmatimonadales bacterium]